ncbi:ribosomal RNA small subunit methyltransferase A, partial [Brachyspira pilosicoli]|nr:ribosomal RNA small subunit methyltransferase A [Brachyspira pilosicoli]
KNNFLKSPYIDIDKDKIDEILEKANIDKEIRGESLNIEKVKELSLIIKDYI